MNDGEMQPFALTLDKFLDHAAKWRGTSQVVTARPDGALDRIGYAGLGTRARRVSAVLAAFGVGLGDRVATLAWNTQGHMEAWYGVIGMGAMSAEIGRSHAKWGERPILLAQLRTPLSDAALLAPLEGRVASWWTPDEIVRLDSMPLAATGKIDKLRLRSEYGGAGAEGAT